MQKLTVFFLEKVLNMTTCFGAYEIVGTRKIVLSGVGGIAFCHPPPPHLPTSVLTPPLTDQQYWGHETW